jgi:hypothetical protein
MLTESGGWHDGENECHETWQVEGPYYDQSISVELCGAVIYFGPGQLDEAAKFARALMWAVEHARSSQ